MLNATPARTCRSVLRPSVRPSGRLARTVTVRVYNAKKSREQELKEAYEEQLAYLQRRRERLISPRGPKDKGPQQAPSATAPVVEPAPAKKSKASEPVIKVAVESPTTKKDAGNPLSFLSTLFGAK